MKICSFTNHQLYSLPCDAKPDKLRLIPTPAEQAIRVLLLALDTVNQAGLDGKKLSDLRLVQTYDARKHHEDQVTEIHAKVTHRLKP